LTSKIHVVVRGLGCPVKIALSPGQAHDITRAHQLLDGVPAEVVIADTAYDADHFRDVVQAKNAIAVIPSNPSRSKSYPLDKDLYRERHLVECCFNKLKHFRRIATRYEKTARNFLAMIILAAIAIWLR
jgi:transposase